METFLSRVHYHCLFGLSATGCPSLIFCTFINLLQNVNREMTIKAKNGKEYFLVDVIAQILKYLKVELINYLQRVGCNLEATDFDWVITVPAIWRARGKQMMREAGYKVT